MRVLIHAWHSATTGDSVLVEYTTAWFKEKFQAEVEWASPRKQPSMVKDFDLLILGPCGVIYDPGPGPNQNYPDYMVSWLFEAYKAGVPFYAFSVGVQDLHRTEKAQLWARALNLSNGIITRDPHSAEMLKEIGVKAKIETCTSLAYTLPGFKAKMGPDPTLPVLGINLKQRHDPWKQALQVLRHHCDLRFMVFMISEQDIGNWLELPWDPFGTYNLQNIGHVYEGLDFLVSSHLHSHIFAINAGVPFLQLSNPQAEHEKKTAWSLEQLAWPHVWTLEDSPESLIEKVKVLMENAEPLRKRLIEIRAEMWPRAQRNFEILEEWIREEEG